MKERLHQVVDDALSRNWPTPKRRDVAVKSHHDMVSVLVGMRRTGKTWLCFQQMHDLMDQGMPQDRILYLNFEDDRMTGLSSDQLQWLTEFYYARNPSRSVPWISGSTGHFMLFQCLLAAVLAPERARGSFRPWISIFLAEDSPPFRTWRRKCGTRSFRTT